MINDVSRVTDVKATEYKIFLMTKYRMLLTILEILLTVLSMRRQDGAKRK